MSRVIPKEQLSAYERWEMASFGEPRARQQPESPAAIAAVERQKAEQAQQLERLREQARLEGYAAGLEQGRAAGLEAGRAAAMDELARLRAIAESFGGEVARADEVIANELLDLALDLSKAMVKTALAIRPQIVLPVISEAIRYLPSLQQPALLFLHPDDVALVKAHMDDELAKAGWRIAEDPQLERGGCRVETATNQIDASASTRWQRIAGALGKHSDWLE